MEISELTLKLIIILIPGAIGTIIVLKLTVVKEVTPFKFVINSIIIGVFSYLIYQLACDTKVIIENIFNKNKVPFEQLQIWDNISNSKVIPYQEVLFASVFSIVVAFITAAIDTYKIVNRLAKKLGVSYKYGEENLFSYFLNAKETQQIYIRDKKNNLTYYGFVNSYSETDSISEIVMSDVSVYTYEDSEFLYDIEQIYLSFSKADLIIEHAKKLNYGEETKETKST